jgi:hypothetical protein
MSGVRDLERRLKAVEEERARQQSAISPEARLQVLKAAVDNRTATLEEYAEFLSDDMAYWHAVLLASAPLLVACRRAGLFVDGPLAALAYHPGERLDWYTRDWVGFAEAMATRDRSERRRPPMNHPHWDDLYSAEARMSFAMVHLLLGEDDALAIRREVWTCRDREQWTLAPRVVEASEEEGPLIGEFDKDGLWNMQIPRAVCQAAPRSVDPPQSDEDEPVEWVSFAALARAVADWSARGSDQLR